MLGRPRVERARKEDVMPKGEQGKKTNNKAKLTVKEKKAKKKAKASK